MSVCLVRRDYGRFVRVRIADFVQFEINVYVVGFIIGVIYCLIGKAAGLG